MEYCQKHQLVRSSLAAYYAGAAKGGIGDQTFDCAGKNLGLRSLGGSHFGPPRILIPGNHTFSGTPQPSADWGKRVE